MAAYHAMSSIETWIGVALIDVCLTVLASESSHTVTAIVIHQILRGVEFCGQLGSQ